MPIAAELLEILACPVDHAPVSDETTHLVCSSCGRRYPVRDGIPVMLVDQAEPPTT
ncbi:MAG: Trm112 family protein [Chloroflexota bacterium]|nr:Trm112 family protein [Chloroflexota bacterium]